MDGRALSFEEIGIYNGVFVMLDRQTESLWSHYTGEAMDGEMVGATLEWVAIERMQWKRALEQVPELLVPRKKEMTFRPAGPRAKRDRLGNVLPPGFSGTLPKDMNRSLDMHTYGLGVAVKSSHRFYRLDILLEDKVINDVIDGVPVVVMLQDGGEAAAVYSRCLDGMELEFLPTMVDGHPALLEKSSRAVWLSNGTHHAGEFAGKQLNPVRSLVTDWYGWAASFPNTSVYPSLKK